VNGELISERHVGGDKLDSAFHELPNKSNIPGKPVELGHDEPRLELLTDGERGGKLRPVVPLAALDLDEFFGIRP
jgi:hypothetical protein